MIRSMLVMAVLALPGLALAQDKPAASGDSDKKLAELEAKLQSLLKEIQSLRGAKTEAAPKTTEKKGVIAHIETGGKPERRRIVEIDEKTGKVLRVTEEDKSKAPAVTTRPAEGAERWRVELKTDAVPGKTLAVLEDVKGGKKEIVLGQSPEARTWTHRTSQPNVAGFTVRSGDANTVHLMRVTYTLDAAKAKALDDFLKANAKAQVLETKVDGDKLVVTTTPDVQATVGQVVGLMTGKPVAGGPDFFRYSINERNWNVLPATPKAPEAPKPATSTKPAAPAKPVEKR